MDNNSNSRTVKMGTAVEALFDGLLWVTLILVLVASFNHVAAAFNSLERADSAWVGYLAAAAVDLALAAIAYVRQQRKVAKMDTQMLTGGIVFLALISMLANIWHGIDVLLDGAAITTVSLASIHPIDYVRVAALSATLPLIILYLGEILSVPGSKKLLKDLLSSVQELKEALQAKTGEAQVTEAALQATEAALQVALTKAKDQTKRLQAHGRQATSHEKQGKQLADARKALQAAENDLQAAENDLQAVKMLYGAVGPLIQAVAEMKMLGNRTGADIANEFEVSESMVSRIKGHMNGKVVPVNEKSPN